MGRSGSVVGRGPKVANDSRRQIGPGRGGLAWRPWRSPVPRLCCFPSRRTAGTGRSGVPSDCRLWCGHTVFSWRRQVGVRDERRECIERKRGFAATAYGQRRTGASGLGGTSDVRGNRNFASFGRIPAGAFVRHPGGAISRSAALVPLVAWPPNASRGRIASCRSSGVNLRASIGESTWATNVIGGQRSARFAREASSGGGDGRHAGKT